MPTQYPVQPLRHRRFWLAPTLVREDVSGCDDFAALDLIIDWVCKGRAFVGRGSLRHDAPGTLPLGLAALRAGRRVRASFCVPIRVVSRSEQPLSIAEVAPGLPPAMRETALRLARRANEIGLPLRVYGSAFWQHASGLPYLHESSDLDLLAQPRSAGDARRWLDALTEIDAISTIRIDGEIETPSGEAVAWRELAGSGDKLLVKSDAGPALRSRHDIWSAWTEAALPC